jgi:hypothetical protein
MNRRSAFEGKHFPSSLKFVRIKDEALPNNYNTQKSVRVVTDILAHGKLRWIPYVVFCLSVVKSVVY